MDFFKDVQNKLKELEEQANQMQQAEMRARQEQKRVGGGASRQKAWFQPKNQAQQRRGGGPGRQRTEREFKSPHHEKPAGTVFTHHNPNFVHHAPPKARARTPVDPEACAIPGQASVAGPPRPGGSIFDDLQGRLDEAFLLQEILGTPMCMRPSFDD